MSLRYGSGFAPRLGVSIVDVVNAYVEPKRRGAVLDRQTLCARWQQQQQEYYDDAHQHGSQIGGGAGG
jgi:hypothetical protein